MKAFLSRIGNTIAKKFGEPSLGVSTLESKGELFAEEPFAKHLFYESYDLKHEIFLNSGSIGFILEATPLVGGDTVANKLINTFFQEYLEEGASIQCLLWADHRITPFLNRWEKARQRGEIYSEIASKRAESYSKEHQSLRIFRFIFSYSVPIENNFQKTIQQLVETKSKFLRSLSSLTFIYSWNAIHLQEALGGMLNFSLSKDVTTRTYNPYQTLSSQLSTGGKFQINSTHLSWGAKEEISFKSFRVIDTPNHWNPQMMQSLIGDLYRDSFRINYPFFIHYGVHCPKQDKIEGIFNRKSQLIENQGKSYSLLRFIPELADELNECDSVRRNLKQGSRFVHTQLSTGVWANAQEFRKAEQSLKDLFKINQFNIAENTCIQLPQFLSILPMSWGEFAQDLKELNVLKTTITNECINFVPIQGEWMGTETPGMLLIGRRGQLLNWNPFDNKSGNYNCVVVGRSGSGKSVFMQELLMTGLSTGAKVYILDVGRSFEKMCSILNGQQIEFSKNSHVCLNPFSKIVIDNQEELETAFNFLKSIISSMAAPSQGTTDFENALIEKALYGVWEVKKNNATITDIAEWLQQSSEPEAKKLGVMLTPYTKYGVYAKYFEGDNNVNFNNPMVLIELEELKGKKDLQTVVLQLFIMSITNQAFLGDRKTPFYICIDEAWDLLRAHQTGLFIETLARRLRKYYGSLIVGTQSIDDFFAAPGAKAAYENSDWMCLLAQKTSSLSQLISSGKTKFSENMVKALETVTTRHGEYSEVMIADTEGNYSIARLILEPFSQLLYTTKAQEYAQLKELTHSGMTIIEAINAIIKNKDSNR